MMSANQCLNTAEKVNFKYIYFITTTIDINDTEAVEVRYYKSKKWGDYDIKQFYSINGFCDEKSSVFPISIMEEKILETLCKNTSKESIELIFIPYYIESDLCKNKLHKFTSNTLDFQKNYFSRFIKTIKDSLEAKECKFFHNNAPEFSTIKESVKDNLEKTNDLFYTCNYHL